MQPIHKRALPRALAKAPPGVSPHRAALSCVTEFGPLLNRQASSSSSGWDFASVTLIESSTNLVTASSVSSAAT